MKKDYLKILLIFIITLGVVFLGLNYLFYSKNAGPNSKAAASLFTVGYDTGAPNPAQNTDFNETINIVPSSDVSLRGYSFRLNFDKTKLQLKNISYLLGVVSPDFGNTNSNLATINQNGSTYLQGEIENSNPFIISNGTTVGLVTLTFTNIGTTGTTVVDGGNTNLYTVDSTGAMTMNAAKVPDLTVNGGGAIGSSSCTSFSDNFSGTTLNANDWSLWTNNNGTDTISSNVVNFSLPASTDSAQEGVTFDSTGKQTITSGDFTEEITMNSLNTALNSANIGYAVLAVATPGGPGDGRVVQIGRNTQGHVYMGVNNVSGSPSSYITVTDKSLGLANNGALKVKIERIGTTVNTYYDILDGQGYHLLGTFSNIFVAPSKIHFGIFNDQTYPQTSGAFSNFVLTCAASNPTPTGTSGTPVPGNVRLNLKLKLQGITGLPACNNSVTVAAKLLKDASGATAVSGTGVFTANGSGIWSGTIGLNVPDVTGNFFLLIAGDKIMPKKFCVSNPIESTPGTYHCGSTGGITIVAGDNNFDLSNVTLLQGDLNQTGIVDSVDFATVKNLLGKNDTTSQSHADINHDCRVDTQDASLIINALSFKVGDSL